jgi:pyridoxal phosphate enzyme (YggS family)
VLDSAALRARLTGVRDRIAAAASRAGRDPASIHLIAVSKTFPVESVRAAADLGQVDFGENKVQEGLAKQDASADLPLRWHLIGHLQSNKVRKAIAFSTIHSIDDAGLLRKLDEAAREDGRTVDVLIQVDLAGEQTKYGAPPGELPAIIEAANQCQSARLIGLMVLPPAVRHPDEARPYFAALRKLREYHLGRLARPGMLDELSMGMSHDFEVAVEEGATLVRVGSGIFGERPPALPPRS